MNVIEKIRATQPSARVDLTGCGGCREKLSAATRAISGPRVEALGGRALILSWGSPDKMAAAGEALDKMGAETFTIKRGSTGWATAAAKYIEEQRPGWVFAWQRLFGADGAAVAAAAAKAGSKIVVMDFGIWPHYKSAIFDGQGENAGSSLVGAFDALMADPVERAAVDAAMPYVEEMAAALRERAAEADTQLERLGLASVPRAAILATLQRKDKVLALDADGARRDHNRVARELVAEAARANRYIVIKPHPQGGDLALPVKGPLHLVARRMKLGKDNDLAMAWLLVNCSHLVTVNSTTWSQALALGKPAATLGRGWYTDNQVCNPCRTIRGVILTPGHLDAKRGRRFVGLMISRCLPADKISDPARLGPLLKRLHVEQQRSEVRGQRSEVGGQRPETDEQIWGFLSRGAGIRLKPVEIARNLTEQGARGLYMIDEYLDRWTETLGSVLREAGLEMILGFHARAESVDREPFERALKITRKLALGNVAHHCEWVGGAGNARRYLALAAREGFEWVCPITHRCICGDLKAGGELREALGQTLGMCLCGYVLAGYVHGDSAVPHQGWKPDGRPFTSLSGRNLFQEYGLTAEALRSYLAPMNVVSGGGFMDGLRAGTRVYARRLGFKGLVIGMPFALSGKGWDSATVGVLDALATLPLRCGDVESGYKRREP